MFSLRRQTVSKMETSLEPAETQPFTCNLVSDKPMEIQMSYSMPVKSQNKRGIWGIVNKDPNAKTEKPEEFRIESEEDEKYIEKRDSWPKAYGKVPLSQKEFNRQEKALGHVGPKAFSYEGYIKMFNHLKKNEEEIPDLDLKFVEKTQRERSQSITPPN